MADIVEISKRISELPYYNGGFEQAAKDNAMLPLSVGAATNARLGVGEFSRYINQSIDGKLRDALNGLAELEDLEDLERRFQDKIDSISLIPRDATNHLVYLGLLEEIEPTPQLLTEFAQRQATALFGVATLKTGFTVRDAQDRDWRWVDDGDAPPPSPPPPTSYTVLANVTGNGTVSGTGQFVSGTSVTITATPGDGYELTTIVVDGITVSSPHTFAMPARNVTISATFTRTFEEIPVGNVINLTHASSPVLTMVGGDSIYPAGTYTLSLTRLDGGTAGSIVMTPLAAIDPSVVLGTISVNGEITNISSKGTWQINNPQELIKISAWATDVVILTIGATKIGIAFSY